MPEPTSARAGRARSPMSKTAAKRQAHRESSMYRELVAGRWVVKTPGRGIMGADEDRLDVYSSFAAARRALAAWRAERVRELLGVSQ